MNESAFDEFVDETISKGKIDIPPNTPEWKVRKILHLLISKNDCPACEGECGIANDYCTCGGFIQCDECNGTGKGTDKINDE